MSRLYQSLRPFLRPSRLARMPSGQTVRLERVRLRKPPSWLAKTLRPTKGTVGLFILIMLLPTPSFLKSEDKDNGEDKNQRKDKNKNRDKDQHRDQDRDEDDASSWQDWDDENGDLSDEDGDPVGGFFFPLPLTLKKVPGEPYSGTSPEWTEYAKISRDPNASKEMEVLLVNYVIKAFKNTPRLVQFFGEDIKLFRFHLDIEFPYEAPPTYEYTGLLYDENGLSLATLPCDPLEAHSIQHTYWPRPVAMGVWTFCTEVAARIAFVLGSESERQTINQKHRAQQGPAPIPVTQSNDVQKTAEKMRQKTTRQPDKVDDPAGAMASSTDQSTSAASLPASDSLALSTSGDQDSLRAEERKLAAKRAVDKSIKACLREWWSPGTYDPPRGGVMVSGIVELDAARAWIAYEVVAWYDPKLKQIDPLTFQIRGRKARAKIVQPRR